MTRCIFRKPKRQLRLSHWVAIVSLLMGSALCLELQAQLYPDQHSDSPVPQISLLHRP